MNHHTKLNRAIDRLNETIEDPEVIDYFNSIRPQKKLCGLVKKNNFDLHLCNDIIKDINDTILKIESEN